MKLQLFACSCASRGGSIGVEDQNLILSFTYVIQFPIGYHSSQSYIMVVQSRNIHLAAGTHLPQ